DSSNHAGRYGNANYDAAGTAEMFLRVAHLIAVISSREFLGSHRAGTIAAFVKEFRFGDEIDLPALLAESYAEVDVFIPGGIEPFIKPSNGFVSVPPYHDGRSRCLRDLHRLFRL